MGNISFHELKKFSGDANKDGYQQLLVRSEEDLSFFLENAKPIIERVKNEGDAALYHFAREFDKSNIPENTLKVPAQDFDMAFEELDEDIKETIQFAADNIKEFHVRQKPEPLWFHEVRPGVFAGEKVEPIPSVACYVPRGKGAFPSVMLMTVIPAVIAGVKEIAIITPPGPDGKIDAASLVAARIAGVENVYKCGGAQAIAAVAYGTETVPKVSKVVGPGSPWVVAAKRLLSDVIDPGLPAGPSESIVLADETANPEIAALDLIVESEHGPDSSAFLVTNSRKVAEEAMATLPILWEKMSEKRADFSRTVLTGQRGGIILCEDFDDAIQFTNDYAPEHLVVLSDEAISYLGQIKNAGEVLLGENTPIPLGNFVLGPNAVLPTSGHAKTASPLSIFDYTKRISIGQVTRKAYPELAKYAHKFATYEGFDGHANAVSNLRDLARNKQLNKSHKAA